MKKLFGVFLCLFLVGNCHAAKRSCFILRTGFKDKKDGWIVEQDSIRKTVDFYRDKKGHPDKNTLIHRITFLNLKDENNTPMPDVIVDWESVYNPTFQNFYFVMTSEVSSVKFVAHVLKFKIYKNYIGFGASLDMREKIMLLKKEVEKEVIKKVQDGIIKPEEQSNELIRIFLMKVTGLAVEKISKAAEMIMEDFIKIPNCLEESKKDQEKFSEGTSRPISIGM